MGLFPTRTVRASSALGSRAPAHAYAPAHAPVRWGPQTRTDTETVRVPERAGFGPRKALLYGVGGLVAAAFWGSHNHRSWWPLAALALALAVRFGLRKLDRRVERLYAGAVGLAACLWLALAWQVGPYRPLMALSLLVLSPVAVLPWVWHRRVRGMATVDWPRAPARVGAAPRFLLELGSAVGRQWGAGREFRAMKEAWPWTAALRAVGLEGSRLIAGHWTAGRPERIVLELENAKTLEDAEQARPRIEAAWRLPAGALRVEKAGEGEGAHRVLLRIRPMADLGELPERIDWPGAAADTVGEPICLGEHAGGRKALLSLVDQRTDWRLVPHIQCTGMTGWGKGGFINLVMAETAHLPEWERWGIDAKEGVELWPWRGMFRYLATDEEGEEDAVGLLTRLCLERKRRSRLNRDRGLRFWRPTPDEPLIMLVVDEWAELSTEAKDLIDTLLRRGRSAGILLILCTQRASAAKTGGTGQTGDSRSQLGTQVSYYQRPGDEELSFGPGAGREGWRTDRLAKRGRALIRCMALGLTEPEPFQTYWVSDEAVARTVARHASVRSQPDSTSEPQERPASPDGERSSRIVPLLPAMPVAAAELVALHVATDPDGDDPLYRLRSALRVAPPEGFHVAELERRTGMSESWLRVELRAMSASGEAVKVRRAYWRAGADSPVRALVQEGQQ